MFEYKSTPVHDPIIESAGLFAYNVGNAERARWAGNPDLCNLMMASLMSYDADGNLVYEIEGRVSATGALVLHVKTTQREQLRGLLAQECQKYAALCSAARENGNAS